MADRSRIKGITSSLVDISTKLETNEAKERNFGVLTYARRGFLDQMIISVGEMPESERSLYERFSQEKAHRLYAEWLRNPEGTFSSWQTRDFDNKKYGGAIACRDIYKGESCDIFSFSGLKENVDEAISLNLSLTLGLITNKEIDRIVNYSNNKVFPEMLAQFRR